MYVFLLVMWLFCLLVRNNFYVIQIPKFIETFISCGYYRNHKFGSLKLQKCILSVVEATSVRSLSWGWNQGVSGATFPPKALGRVHPVPRPAVVAAGAPWLHCSHQPLWSRCLLFSCVRFPSLLSHKDTCGCISGPPWIVLEHLSIC